MKSNRIICSAVWVDDGIKYSSQPKNIKSGFVVCGRRHCNCFTTLSLIYDNPAELIHCKVVQGFLSSEDVFLNRKQALPVANHAKQFVGEKLLSGVLISEDLW